MEGDGFMYLNEESIKDFCKRQSLTWKDREMQRNCIREEVLELMKAPPPEEYEEAVDVIVTILVYAQLSGFMHKIEKEFERKMEVNLQKPIRSGTGKVQNR